MSACPARVLGLEQDPPPPPGPELPGGRCLWSPARVCPGKAELASAGKEPALLLEESQEAKSSKPGCLHAGPVDILDWINLYGRGAVPSIIRCPEASLASTHQM